MARNHGPSRRRDHADAFLPDPASGTYFSVRSDDADFIAREFISSATSPPFSRHEVSMDGIDDEDDELAEHSVFPPPS